MKKTLSISLAILGTTIISSCSREGETETATYRSVGSCQADGKFSNGDCLKSYQQAVRDHDHSGPAFDTRAECESNFGKDQCEPTGTGHVEGQSKYMPYMRGFIIGKNDATVNGVYYPAVAAQPVYQPSGSGGGYYSGGGNLLSSREGGFKMSRSSGSSVHSAFRSVTVSRQGFGFRLFGHA